MEISRRKNLSGARFLSFALENESYCAEINKVKEVMGMVEITPVPQVPEYIKGVINLRGKIVPVVDLRTKFGLEAAEVSKRTSIIVADLEFEGEITLMGVIVDRINEVVSIPAEKITQMSYINSKVKTKYIRGIADTPEGMNIVLDLESILKDDDILAKESLEALNA